MRSLTFLMALLPSVLSLSSGCTNTEDDESAESRASDGGARAIGGASATEEEELVDESLVLGGDIDGIQYFGRWQHDGEEHLASWGAVYFRANFMGTSVSIKLDGGNSNYQYRIDGGEMIVLEPGRETTYELASGLSEGEHSLEFYRRNSGGFGLTTFSGLILDEGKSLAPAPGRNIRKVEILGDSISAGYGNEGTGVTTRATENGYEAYGPQFARMAKAQWSVIAHSGQGMVRNLGELKTEYETGIQMAEEFRLSFFPEAGPAGDWDFDKYQPDVLIVTLGTNDFSWPQWDKDPGADYELTEKEFVDGYSDFLGFARKVYPEAHVFAVGTFISNSTNQFGRANEYICTAVTALTDDKMHCIDPGFTSDDSPWLSSGKDYVGDWTHPTVEGHTKVATRLFDEIAPILGW